MHNLNRDLYAAAQHRLTLGEWTADPEAGLIYGVRGAALSGKSTEGYVQCKPMHGSDHKVMLHRVLWEYVHGPIPDDMEINHINGVKDDNRLANLETVTHADNMLHARMTGLQPPPFGRPPTVAARSKCQKHDAADWAWRPHGRTGWCRVCDRERRARRAAA